MSAPTAAASSFATLYFNAKMTKAKPQHYQVAYNKLYGFLRRKHPEVLKEYKEYLAEVKKRVEEALLCV
jgi:hypothetical protein